MRMSKRSSIHPISVFRLIFKTLPLNVDTVNGGFQLSKITSNLSLHLCFETVIRFHHCSSLQTRCWTQKLYQKQKRGVRRQTPQWCQMKEFKPFSYPKLTVPWPVVEAFESQSHQLSLDSHCLHPV
jgi:hypothetical protein